MNADTWFQQGQLIAVNGFKHFCYDSANNKPCLLILHGYPTSSFDYHKVLFKLERHFRVVVFDHLGFGFSDKPIQYSYHLFDQTDQLLGLCTELGLEQVCVLAHDYGTSIATELLARKLNNQALPVQIKRMVLCNGSMHIEMSALRLIQKLLLNRILGPWVAKLSTKRTFARNLRNVYHNPAALPQREVDAMWQMMLHNQGRQVLPQVTQYIRQRHTHWHRWIGALQSTQIPCHILWAENDPVAVVGMAHVLHQEIPRNTLTLLAGVGHFPMLENPELWARAVVDLLLSDFPCSHKKRET